MYGSNIEHWSQGSLSFRSMDYMLYFNIELIVIKECVFNGEMENIELLCSSQKTNLSLKPFSSYFFLRNLCRKPFKYFLAIDGWYAR